MTETELRTLGSFRRSNHQLWANCTNPTCAHGKALDLDALIGRYFADYDIIADNKNIAKALRCERCGTKGGSFRIIPPARIEM